MTLQTNEDKIYEYLKDKYKKAVITKAELAVEFGVCKSTIDHYTIKNDGVPPYKKLGKAKNAKVVFNLLDVARFLSNTTIID